MIEVKIISESPLVIYVPGWYQNPHYGKVFDEFLSGLKNVKATFIFSPAWYTGEFYHKLDLWIAERSLSGMWTWWIFCNDMRELTYCKNKGLNSCLIHQHAFVDMDKFFITNKNLDFRKYSAVYNAQFISFKRHILCAKIDACALIGYGDANDYYNQMKSELKKCDFINEVLEDGKLLTISDINVNEIYNNSSVGLCLSKEEGGMYAAIEYLLSGIPVVTTLNKGGRDYFFDGRFVIHCYDDSASINEAVFTLKSAYISPEFIRSETIVKVKRERELFFQFMEDQLGCENYSEIFLRKFYSSKLLDRNPLGELINKVRSLNG